MNGIFENLQTTQVGQTTRAMEINFTPMFENLFSFVTVSHRAYSYPNSRTHPLNNGHKSVHQGRQILARRKSIRELREYASKIHYEEDSAFNRHRSAARSSPNVLCRLGSLNLTAWKAPEKQKENITV